jgi:hypothetical protein
MMQFRMNGELGLDALIHTIVPWCELMHVDGILTIVAGLKN